MVAEALLVVAVAPIAEELLFRGVLLHRWAQRWDLRTAIVLTSICFAILHVEPLGHFVFGVAMCALYLRTGSLWAPIVAHALNNAFVVVMIAPSVLRGEVAGPYTLEDFQADWASSIAAFAFGLVGLVWFARRYLRDISVHLPYFPSGRGVPSGGGPATTPSTPDDRPPY
jgi:hypothetical protein